MSRIHDRTEALIGESALQILKKSHVAIFGIGGVGGHAAEAIARAGVGKITLVDADTVAESNINRQLIALRSTIGKPKVDVMRDRIADINPNIEVNALKLFFCSDTDIELDFDYIIDAIDSMQSKLELILRANAACIPIISAMGAGNKLHPELFEIADIFSTSYDPIARKLRKQLKENGINSLKVVYSKEQPVKTQITDNGKPVPASVSFVPGAAGMIMAGECIRELIYSGKR